MQRGDQRLRAARVRHVEEHCLAADRVEFDQALACSGPHVSSGGFMEREYVVESAGAAGQVGEPEMLEAPGGVVPAVDAATDRADPQLLRRTEVQSVDPVMGQTRGRPALVKVAREATAVRVQSVESLLRTHPEPAFGVLGDAIGTLSSLSDREFPDAW